MTRIVCDLPFPVSVNSIWRGGRRRVFTSDEYKRWKLSAGNLWLTQRQKQPRSIQGEFEANLLLVKPDQRRRDLDNYWKAVLDFATSMKLIEDDYLCQSQHAMWVSQSELPTECRLILKAHNS